jgi:hypothetical protein
MSSATFSLSSLPSARQVSHLGCERDLIDRARLAGEPTMMTRFGKPGGVVVSADWYQEAADCLAWAADGPGCDQGGADQR